MKEIVEGIDLRGDGCLGLMISDDDVMAIINTCVFREIVFCLGTNKVPTERTADTLVAKISRAEGIAARGNMDQVESLIKSDESIISAENLHRSSQFGGSDPFLTASRAVKLSPKTRCN